MSALAERKLQQALAALERGERERAEALCEEALERAPRHPRALHLLGALRLEQGREQEAREMLERAAALAPGEARLLRDLGYAELRTGRFAQAEERLRAALALGWRETAALVWLGQALAEQGKYGEAEALFRQAAEREPHAAGHWVNLGNAERLQGKAEAAERSYRRALALAPGHAGALLGLGQALEQGQRRREALEAYRRAAALAPSEAEPRYRLAVCLNLLGSHGEAERVLRALLADRPDHTDALNELGIALQELGRLEEAEACFRGAIEREPGNADWHANLGMAFLAQGRAREAVPCFERALALQPGHPRALGSLGLARLEAGDRAGGSELLERAIREGYSDARALCHLGTILHEAGQYGRAEACYRRALELDPGHADAETDLGFALLYRGNFADGWRHHERRFDTAPPRALRRLPTNPEAARRILASGEGRLAVWAEQGLGDEIVFASLLPQLLERGVELVYEADARLLPALRRSFPGASFVPRSDPPQPQLAAAQAQIAAGSLPGLLRNSLQDFAQARERFLLCDQARSQSYRERLERGRRGLCVAVSWKSTGRRRAVQWKKSASLAAFAPLARLPGVQLVDVQYGDTEAERAAFAQATGVEVVRFRDVDHFNDVEGVMAVIAACDLVITTSNVTAHFAGALGKPTWLIYLAARAPFHYWVPGPDGRSLWYPSVQIVTAPELASWEALLEHVARRLEQGSGAGAGKEPRGKKLAEPSSDG